jgi:hypothetical protein
MMIDKINIDFLSTDFNRLSFFCQTAGSIISCLLSAKPCQRSCGSWLRFAVRAFLVPFEDRESSQVRTLDEPNAILSVKGHD